MNAKIKKSIISGLAALTVAGSLATVSAPAQAFPKFPKPIFHHHGFGWGAAALGLGLGALAVSSARAYDDDDCGRVRQPVVNRWGDVVGYRYVRAC